MHNPVATLITPSEISSSTLRLQIKLIALVAALFGLILITTSCDQEKQVDLNSVELNQTPERGDYLVKQGEVPELVVLVDSSARGMLVCFNSTENYCSLGGSSRKWSADDLAQAGYQVVKVGSPSHPHAHVAWVKNESFEMTR